MKQLRTENAAASAGAHQPRRAAARQARQEQQPAAVSAGRTDERGRAVAMTKSELIARLAQRYPQLVAKDAEYAVKMILDAMTQSLLAGHRIEIRGFGSFGLNYRPPRIGPQSRSRARRCRCRRSTCRTSRPARSCASASTAKPTRRAPRRRAAGARRRKRRAIGRRLRASCASSPGRSGCSLFLLLLVFAAKNTEPVDAALLFRPGPGRRRWCWCCSAFFAAGALFGVLAAARHACCGSGARSRACEATHAPVRSRPTHRRRRVSRPMEFEYWWLLALSAVLRPGLARGAHRHQAPGAGIARAAALVLQGPELPAQRAAGQGDRGVHRGGQGRPGDDRAALRAGQPVPPPRRVPTAPSACTRTCSSAPTSAAEQKADRRCSSWRRTTSRPASSTAPRKCSASWSTARSATLARRHLLDIYQQEKDWQKAIDMARGSIGAGRARAQGDRAITTASSRRPRRRTRGPTRRGATSSARWKRTASACAPACCWATWSAQRAIRSGDRALEAHRVAEPRLPRAGGAAPARALPRRRPAARRA